jgi:hypothetical protein
MMTPTTNRRLFALAALAVLALAAGDRARGEPVKVTIQAAKSELGEGATLPVDPTIRVRYGIQQPGQMPGLGGLNGERYTYSPAGGHEIMIQIDGQIYIFGQPPGKWDGINVPLGKGSGGRKREGVQHTWVMNNVRITQIVEIIPSKTPPKGATGNKRHMDVMLVRYVVENKDTKPHDVGIRNTIDIYLIDNDGALFASPQTHKDQVVNGHEFKGEKMPDYLQVLQRPDVKNPQFVTHFTLKVGKLEPPTKFICTNLGACFNGGWDIPAQPAGDSAVGIIWDPKKIAPGGKRDMGLAYGIGVASNPENEGRVSMHLGGSFEVGQQFVVTCYVDDPLDSQSLTLELPAGLTRVEGKAVQAVPGFSDKNASVVLWKVRVDKLGDYSVKVRSSNGMLYNTLLKIEPSATPELIRIEPKPPAEDPPMDPKDPVVPKGTKSKREELQLQLKKANEALKILQAKEKSDGATLAKLLKEQAAAEAAAKGKNDPKLEAAVRELTKAVADMDQQLAQTREAAAVAQVRIELLEKLLVEQGRRDLEDQNRPKSPNKKTPKVEQVEAEIQKSKEALITVEQQQKALSAKLDEAGKRLKEARATAKGKDDPKLAAQVQVLEKEITEMLDRQQVLINEYQAEANTLELLNRALQDLSKEGALKLKLR